MRRGCCPDTPDKPDALLQHLHETHRLGPQDRVAITIEPRRADRRAGLYGVVDPHGTPTPTAIYKGILQVDPRREYKYVPADARRRSISDASSVVSLVLPFLPWAKAGPISELR